MRVFLQFGHIKQFRAHLPYSRSKGTGIRAGHSPVLLSADTRTGHLEQAVRAVIPADFHHNASVTSYCVAFLAKVEAMEGMKAI